MWRSVGAQRGHGAATAPPQRCRTALRKLAEPRAVAESPDGRDMTQEQILEQIDWFQQKVINRASGFVQFARSRDYVRFPMPILFNKDSLLR